jgi:hypothetical protein
MFRRMVSGSLLALMLTSAHAAWKPKPPTTTLPVEMQGNWCRDNDRNKWETFHRSKLRSSYGVKRPRMSI